MGVEIIPTPKEVHLGSDTLAFDQLEFRLEYGSEIESHAQTANAIALTKQLPLHWTAQSSGALVFKLNYQGQDRILDEQMKSKIDPQVLDKKEGYYLQIDQQGILIYGFDEAGMLYAVQSLRQLLAAGTRLPTLEVTDYPTLSFRGVMDDISRGPLSNLEFMREQVRRLSLLKLNVLTFYVEHVIRTKRHPDYASKHALTLPEIENLAAYADSFNVQLMGSFQSLGHFKEILKIPNFTHLGASERMLKPGDPAAKSFLMENYDDLIPAFNHPMFNINADEAYDLERGPRLKKLADSMGVGQIYLNHVKPLLQHIIDQGKTPAMWGDMLLKHPEVISQLPKETVVFTWNYSAEENFKAFIDPFATQGVEFMAAPGIVNSYRIWPDLHEAEKNISVFSHQAWKGGSTGVLTTVWDDGGRHFFACDWWGIIVGSQHSWNPENQNHPGLSDTYYKNFYSGHGTLYSQFLQELKDIQNIGRLFHLDASLIEMQFNADQAPESYIDTSDFSRILDQLEKIQLTTKALLAQEHTTSPLFARTDFDYWQFRFEELEQSILSQKELLKVTKIETANKSSFAANTIRIMCLWQKSRWKTLYKQFETLWFSENNENWFNSAKAPLLKNIEFWSDLHVRAAALRAKEPTFPRFKASNDIYFKYWLSADFTPGENESPNYDFFTPEGGELNQKPSAVGYYLKQDGEFHSWRKIISQNPNKVWLDNFFHVDSTTTVYTSCQIMTSEAMSVPFELLTSGQSELILNGEFVPSYKGNSPRNTLRLQEGRNYLLIKHLRPTSHPWSFSFRLPGQVVNNRKYRYYIEANN